MRRRKVDPAKIDSTVIAEGARIIRAGGLVAFPTETVYGLGVDATNDHAVAKIFAAKGRPSYNPLIVHVADTDAAKTVVAIWPDTARDLTTRFWPGPLTLVLPKGPGIPGSVTAGLTTVGVRAPAHPVALALLRAAGRPIAAPSANLSMQLSPTDADHIAAGLEGHVDLIIDAGPTNIGIESTVLDLSSAIPTILRPGIIGRAEIAAVIGEVCLANERPADGAPRASPGMLERHYAPRTRLVLAGPGRDALDTALAREAADRRRIVVLARSDYAARTATVARMPGSPREYARVLFATLHRLDAAGFEVMIVESVPEGDDWDGVRDRLARAAAR